MTIYQRFLAQVSYKQTNLKVMSLLSCLLLYFFNQNVPVKLKNDVAEEECDLEQQHLV